MEAKYYIVDNYSEGRGDTRRAVRVYSQAFNTEEEARSAIEALGTRYPEYKLKPWMGGYRYQDIDSGKNCTVRIESLLSRPGEEEGKTLITRHVYVEPEEVEI